MFNSKIFKFGSVAAALVMVLSLAFAAPAEARMGGSFGSRGFRTFSSPSITQMAPNPVSPIQRSMTTNNGGYTAPGTSSLGNQGYSGFGRGGFLSGLGGGIVGGMLGGLLFHGLFGSALGYGFGGIGGGFSSIFQILLIGGLIWFAFRWFRNQQAVGLRGYGQATPWGATSGGYGSAPSYGAQAGYGASNGGSGQRDEIGVTNTDLETFEHILSDVQGAYSREDHQGLRRYTTPEMVSYLSEELADNATHGLRNDVSDIKFIAGELSEAWREGNRDYATVAMNWTAIDVMRDRQTGEIKKGDATTPAEAKELWTFTRENGGQWLLSAIQDAR
jgi:predicted lipid-binding transport protein (Tim44 family)